VKAIDDVKLYHEVLESANVLDMKSDLHEILCVISSVLHLGNIQFDDKTLGDSKTLF
jgi:myosin heavy subunit